MANDSEITRAFISVVKLANGIQRDTKILQGLLD